MIDIKNLSKTYKISKNNIVDAVKDISFSVNKGEVVTIIGPSGSGKSSLLNILGGLDRSYKGEVLVDGKEIHEYDSNFYRRKIVGTIFQQFYLIPALSVIENISLPMVFNSRSEKKKIKEKSEEIMERVGLTSHRNHRPKELSGGQAQRVAIARALVSGPKILLADEPTGNLDSKTGGEIMNLLLEINKEQNTTLLIVTHDTELILGAKRKIFLKDGKIDSDSK